MWRNPVDVEESLATSINSRWKGGVALPLSRASSVVGEMGRLQLRSVLLLAGWFLWREGEDEELWGLVEGVFGC